MLNINTLIEWNTDEETETKAKTPLVERVLYYDSIEKVYVLIDIFSEKVFPIIRSKEEIENAYANENFRTLEKDPFANYGLLEEQILEKHKKIRDAAWDSISSIVEATGLQPFLSETRGELVTEAVKRSGSIKKTIYLRYRRYYQQGLSKNALIPSYKNCGKNNEWREKGNFKKLGKPNRISKKEGKKHGVIITPAIKKKFKRGVKKHYERTGETNIRWAYRRTINDHFNIGYDIKDNVPIPVLPDAKELPTFDQFYYWYNKEFRNPKQEITARFGKTEFEMNHRALLGDSTAMAFGPGSIYQLDATIADVYLVSEFIRTRILGRPVIYFVMDVFSRYIVGIAVTLEGPSWLGAMLALDNVVTDKVNFCAEYGITITEDQWNCISLGESLLGDRGEMEGYNVENLANNLNIRIQVAPPYRGDFKGIVERAFGKVNKRLIHFLPGAVRKQRKRGERDYRLDAKLTIREFYKLLITYVLDYNANNYLSWYKKDEYQIADQVELYPQDMWNWGIENRSGHMRTVPQEIVRLNLLPRKSVSVTKHGIHFENDIYYTCDIAREEGWFERARERGSWKIDVAYDPRNLTNIYVPLNNGSEIATCYLTPAAKTFNSYSWYDTADYFESKAEHLLENKTRELQTDAEFHAKQQQIVLDAAEKTNADKAKVGFQSAKSQTENIRENRAEERELERSQKYFDLAEDGNSDVNDLEEISEENEIEEYVPPKNNLSEISKYRKKLKGVK